MPESHPETRKRSIIQVRKIASALIVLAATHVTAQSPNDGRITATSYESSVFNFYYTLPSVLRTSPLTALTLPKGPNANEYGLFYARQGAPHFGVLAIAEKLHAVTPHSNGLRDGADFLDRVANFRPEQRAVILSRKHLTNASGIVVDILDYTEGEEPSSAITAQIGDFLIVFKFDARSAAELAEMDRSAIAIRHNTAR